MVFEGLLDDLLFSHDVCQLEFVLVVVVVVVVVVLLLHDLAAFDTDTALEMGSRGWMYASKLPGYSMARHTSQQCA